jgi:hypothetical protein
MNLLHWVILDPSAGWIRTLIVCVAALKLTNVVMRRFGWDQDKDVDEDEES